MLDTRSIGTIFAIDKVRLKGLVNGLGFQRALCVFGLRKTEHRLSFLKDGAKVVIK
jgi:hypothetical protein